jgi:hypothetical protein
MKRLTFLNALAFVLAVFVPFTAAADGNDLLRQCAVAVDLSKGSPEKISKTEALQAGHCLGLVQGVVGTNKIYELTTAGNSAWVCTPGLGIENRQAVRVVVKYLEDHPEDLHLGDGTLVQLALQNAFPCTRKSDKSDKNG